MTDVLKILAWIISFILTIYTSYFTVMCLFSFLPLKKGKKFEPKNKFAVVIAARNEEFVIGNLIDSLKRQQYPQELYDIIVIPNNCTDNTRMVALSKNTIVFDCKRIITSKGDVLGEFFDWVLTNDNSYDAFCVFDADNLVSENFLSEINNAMCMGARIGQGFRDSKNPYDTYISSCSTIYFYMVNKFISRARGAANLSAMLNGSGFFVIKDVIKKLGGWHTKTMTEDIEFSTKCVLAGEKIHWVPEAIYYDEQPLSFPESWKQRKRWSTGIIQCCELYVPKLFKSIIKHKSLSAFDFMMVLFVPFMQIIYLASAVLAVILYFMIAQYNFFPRTDVFLLLFLSLDVSYFACFAITLFFVIAGHNKKKIKMLKGVFSFWFFIQSWLIINILCVFKKQTEWTQINHTRNLKINELAKDDNSSFGSESR